MTDSWRVLSDELTSIFVGSSRETSKLRTSFAVRETASLADAIRVCKLSIEPAASSCARACVVESVLFRRSFAASAAIDAANLRLLKSIASQPRPVTPNRAREETNARACIKSSQFFKKQLQTPRIPWRTGRTTCLWTGSRCAGAVGGGMGEVGEASHQSSHAFRPLSFSRSSPLRSNPRFRSSLKRSRCANTSASECAARGLRLAATSQRPHSDLTATSQRPHSDLTETSQRPHSDLTATPPRPHSDLTLGLFISPLIH